MVRKAEKLRRRPRTRSRDGWLGHGQSGSKRHPSIMAQTNHMPSDNNNDPLYDTRAWQLATFSRKHHGQWTAHQDCLYHFNLVLVHSCQALNTLYYSMYEVIIRILQYGALLKRRNIRTLSGITIARLQRIAYLASSAFGSTSQSIALLFAFEKLNLGQTLLR
jgi:hypothetical protein